MKTAIDIFLTFDYKRFEVKIVFISTNIRYLATLTRLRKTKNLKQQHLKYNF